MKKTSVALTDRVRHLENDARSEHMPCSSLFLIIYVLFREETRTSRLGYVAFNLLTSGRLNFHFINIWRKVERLIWEMRKTPAKGVAVVGMG